MKRLGWILFLVLVLCPSVAMPASWGASPAPVGVSRGCGPGGCDVGGAPSQPAYPVQSSTNAAICRVEVAVSRGFYGGSAVYVSVPQDQARSYLLTAYHNLGEDGGASVQGITTIWPDGRRLPAEVVGTDPMYDLAVLATEPLTGIRPYPVSASDPAPGEEVRWGGYAPDRGVRVNPRFAFGSGGGPFQDWCTVNHSAARNYTTPRIDQGGESLMVRITRGRVVSGYSGGPVVTLGGRLLGIVSGTDDSILVGCGPGPIRRLLARLFGRRPAQVIVQQQPDNRDALDGIAGDTEAIAGDTERIESYLRPAPEEIGAPEPEGYSPWWIALAPCALLGVVGVSWIAKGVEMYGVAKKSRRRKR